MCRIVILFALFLTTGCSDNDAEKLRRVSDKTFDRISTLAQQVGEELGQTLLEQKPKSDSAVPSVAERVKQRLRWDRDLATLTIEVSEREDLIVLTGKVKAENQKKQAQDLADRTLGVKKVQNDLQFEEIPNESSSGRSAVPGGAN